MRMLSFPVRANEPYWNHLITFVKRMITHSRASFRTITN